MSFDLRQKARARGRAFSRDPVGGVLMSGDLTPQVPAVMRPVPKERGLTNPYTVTGVSQQLFDIDHERRFFFAQNNDALGVVFIAFGGQGAAINLGFRLPANGGAILLDMNVPTARVFVIGTIAVNSNVTIVTG